MELNIVKFGGSVITDGTSANGLDRKTVRRLAEELPGRGRGCILIHGTGRVGKPPAIRYGYLESGHLPAERTPIALQIRADLRRLNQMFVETMLSASVAAIPLDAAAVFNARMDGFRDPPGPRRIGALLDRGLTPVFYGDMVPAAGGGFRVFSSDVIALILCRALRPEKMLFLSDVPGVYPDGGGEPLAELGSREARRLARAASDARDVSGGMSRKGACALEIARHCGACFIGSGLEPHSAMGFLSGQPVPGTRILRP